jgi:hypothetical protein
LPAVAGEFALRTAWPDRAIDIGSRMGSLLDAVLKFQLYQRSISTLTPHPDVIKIGF